MLNGLTLADAIHNLSDANADVRYQAAWTLQYIGDARAVNALLMTIADADLHVRVASAQALGRIGDERALDALLKMMNHASAEERYVAALALGRLTYKAIAGTLKVTEGLRVALRDEDVYVRCAAGMSLSLVGGFTIAPKVFDGLSRPEAKFYEAAARQIEKQIDQSNNE